MLISLYSLLVIVCWIVHQHVYWVVANVFD